MPRNEQSQSLAVLIDADNTSARYAHAIFEEIVKLGEANVRRIYGDFSGSRLTGWDREIESLAILQHQQRNNTTGKNASDIALVIDAGADKADGGAAAAAPAAKKEPPSKAVKIIGKAIEDSDDDGWANLGGVGRRILGAAPDFDPRTYGCPNLSTLVTKSGGFEIRNDSGTAVYIRRKVSGRKAAGKPAGKAAGKPAGKAAGGNSK